MRPSFSRSVLVLVLFVLTAVPSWGQTLSTAEPESVGMSSERLERLTSTLEGYVSDERIAGAVAIVARKGKIAYLEAVGMRDRESNSPMELDSIFRIASQTKALTST